jgi:hypothetical protein
VAHLISILILIAAEAFMAAVSIIGYREKEQSTFVAGLVGQLAIFFLTIAITTLNQRYQ